MCPLRNRESHNAINAHASQDDRQHSEEAGQPREQPLLKKCLVNLLLLALEVEESQVWVHALRHSPNCRRQGKRIPHCSDLEINPADMVGVLEAGNVGGGGNLSSQVVELSVRNDPDDLDVGGAGLISHTESPA